MSETEDYPGPSHNHPEKEGKGKDPGEQADEGMVKAPATPEGDSKKQKRPRPNLKKKAKIAVRPK